MKKPFDCLKMKEEIQRKVQRETAGMTAVQFSQHVRRKLSSDTSPVGDLWRKLDMRNHTAPISGIAVCEPTETYRASPAEPASPC